MGREGKATWSNDRAILNFYRFWLGWDDIRRYRIVIVHHSYHDLLCKTRIMLSKFLITILHQEDTRSVYSQCHVDLFACNE